ncbi:WD repeat-containing protein 3 isoform X2 [Diabrotica undecimpunctata]|uniref:WD repeat-containing protein 3 isoform X2 n=1 Tax=Diabrotica undecimpunctata TaxID=50387 RepID=UPI003B63A2D1
MGLTKQYLRYVPSGNFNIIATQSCNVCFVTLEGQVGRFLAVGACEHIIIWDLRLGEKAQVLPGEKAVVTAITASPNKRHLAAGYSNGNIHIYDLKSSEIISIFSGHKSEITTLIYDRFGHKLASGSKDTDVIVWDTVAEVGLCRLTGHKGMVTQLQFMKDHPILISASKDSFVKFWELETHHCFKTLTGHQTEVWTIALMQDDKYLVTGCGDAELRVYKLSFRDSDCENKNIEYLPSRLELTSLEDSEHFTHPLQCHKVGALLRRGRGRVISMYSDATGQILGCHGTDMQIEFFQFLYEEDAQLKLKKRLKKEKKKTRFEENANTDQDKNLISLRDEVKRFDPIKLSDKPKSFHLVLGSGGELRVAVNLANNIVELYTIQSSVKDSDPKLLRSISNQGHRTEIRSVCFSSDNLAIASGSAEAVKMWNRPSQACLRTIRTEYILSTVFAPGDRHLLAGLKNGKLLIMDISTGDILEEITAHATELWSVNLTPDLRGCVTGGGDSTVKFWKFELIIDEKSESKVKVLSVLHTRTLKLEDSVLCVKISPNGKLIAVGLLDSTVKIFFVDTLKFYLSLYGHKLPVLCLDISSDSMLIATGSADRNIKIWGMDFGDCHKSIFAHDDSVTGLQFVPKTHYFFTCGKDGKVKEWDGDTYEKIITLQMPKTEAEWKAIAEDYYNRWNFPNCVGAMDGKHVALQAPINSGSEFFNYKGFFSIVLLFSSTVFNKFLEENTMHLSAENLLPKSDVKSPFIFVADDAFPLSTNIMKPYAGLHPKGSSERVFNYRVSSARRLSENVFGIISSVFRVFRKPMLLEPTTASKIILTACYLHNFLRKSASRNIYNPPGTYDADCSDTTDLIPGAWRSEVCNQPVLVNLAKIPRKSAPSALHVRNVLKDYFMTPEGEVPWQYLK